MTAERIKALEDALRKLLARDELNTCQHENTHRGGGIWEICEDCCAKWADDRGGKPTWADPQEWVAARAALAASQPAQPVAWVGGRSYRKKPVVIKAVQWTGENLREVIAFTDGPPETKSHHAGMMWEQYEALVGKDGLKIYTLEGKMDASLGDWIIKGVKGEFYPCKPDIFAATYEPASQPAPDCHQPDLVTSDSSQPAQPVAWVEKQELEYLRMVTGNKGWGGYQRVIMVGGEKEGCAPLYAGPQPIAVQDAQCCMCGKRGLSTAEDGGPECELSDGRWVCSRLCYSRAVDGVSVQDAARVPEIAALIEAATAAKPHIRGALGFTLNAALRAIAEGRA